MAQQLSTYLIASFKYITMLQAAVDTNLVDPVLEQLHLGLLGRDDVL